MTLLTTISWPLLLWSGLTAVVISTWVLTLLRRAGATRYLPRAYWSCGLFGSTRAASLLLAGALRMTALIVIFPLAYSLLFAYLDRAEAIVGLSAGVSHGLLAGLLLPLAGRRCAGAQPPGLLGWKLGRATPLVLLFVHAVYGTLLGYIYVNG
ncbi:MAG: hypothetical protein ACT443_11320 [Gemmatimonadota bacterium]